LSRIAAENPGVEFNVVLRRGKHPYVKAEYSTSPATVLAADCIGDACVHVSPSANSLSPPASHETRRPPHRRRRVVHTGLQEPDCRADGAEDDQPEEPVGEDKEALREREV